jgi:hypothetical protein
MSSGVEFDEDKFSYARPTPAQGSPVGVPNAAYTSPVASNTRGMHGWLMRHGVKSAAGAQVVLIAVVILNIVVTFVVIKFFILA